MNADLISPEEQIRRVARAYLAMPRRPRSGEPGPSRPDLRGLIEMLERHLDGDLPPIAGAPPGDRNDPPE